jgi:hypothetical protein
MRFSDRIGATKIPEVVYLDDVPKDLLNSIWNVLVDIYDIDDNYWKNISRNLASDFFKIAQDDLPYDGWRCKDWIKKKIYNLQWFEVYNVVEFIVLGHSLLGHPSSREKIIEYYNFIFERERSGYRFVAGVLSPISSVTELEKVSQALASNKKQSLPAQRHLEAAVQLMSKRPSPDYRNAIKEAISAVESICIILGGEKGDSLKEALKALDRKTSIHPSLREAFIKMYGYTSDENGIRHAMLEVPNIEFADAKYMVVACSAFMNYVVQKSENAGILR